jgi:cellulose synthase/poly-beta-1,6-N-acetylglucosamine synthase-like glycosyltransferase
MSLTALARDALLVLYSTLTLLLALVGLYYGLVAVERIVRKPARETPPLDWPGDDPPTVTVQVPVYNERHVVGRLLDAIGELRWPRRKLQVQVIDDSTDRTGAVVAEEVARLRDRGVAVEHVERDARRGYKAGATQAGLRTATGEFVALFDADFVPPPDFLEETVPHFSDPAVGCVQTRWDHVNEDYSWFTRAQALALDAHFAVEQWVRARAGSLMSFNATSCVWRRETIEDVSGWSSETVAEDLDLTATALCRGWEFVYTEGYAVPCEIPVTLSGFVRQQTRWARGSAQNVRKHLIALLRSPALSPWATFHSVLHVSHYLFFPLLLAWLVAHAVVAAAGRVPAWILVGGFLGTTPGPLAFLLLGQRLTDRPGRLERVLAVVPLTLVGVGIAWRMTRAVASGLVEMGGSFARTPKFRSGGSRRSWRESAYGMPLGSTLPETAIVGWCALGVVGAVLAGAYRMAPSRGFLAVYCAVFVGYATARG